MRAHGPAGCGTGPLPHCTRQRASRLGGPARMPGASTTRLGPGLARLAGCRTGTGAAVQHGSRQAPRQILRRLAVWPYLGPNAAEPGRSGRSSDEHWRPPISGTARRTRTRRADRTSITRPAAEPAIRRGCGGPGTRARGAGSGSERLPKRYGDDLPEAYHSVHGQGVVDDCICARSCPAGHRTSGPARRHGKVLGHGVRCGTARYWRRAGYGTSSDQPLDRRSAAPAAPGHPHPRRHSGPSPAADKAAPDPCA